jgi:hypothetical protein
MPAIIKTDVRVKNADAFKYLIQSQPSYFLLSGTSEWDDETSPPTPRDTTEWENITMSELIGIKKIQQTDIISVAPRTNWVSGAVFDQYDHQVDLVNTRNPATGNFYRFYVITEDFNVYKCLSNSYGTTSLNRPTGTTPSPFQTPDGYVWKYMYTIQSSDAFKFMTSNWMPCYTLTYNDGSAQWNSQQSAISGTVDNIDVLVQGTGYSFSSPPTVTIVGDGTGATASPVVDDLTGELVDILVTNAGSDYTTATITIVDSGGSGTGGQARVIVGPRCGHGSDPRIELGATYSMVKVSVDGDEGGVFPVGISYRTSGIINLPLNPSLTAFRVSVTVPSAQLYFANETVTGATSGATGNVLLVDYTTGTLYLDNVVGGFVQSESISSQTYNATPIQTVYTDFKPLTAVVHGAGDVEKSSGRLFYISNREKISRVSNQQEDLIAILSF